MTNSPGVSSITSAAIISMYCVVCRDMEGDGSPRRLSGRAVIISRDVRSKSQWCGSEFPLACVKYMRVRHPYRYLGEFEAEFEDQPRFRMDLGALSLSDLFRGVTHAAGRHERQRQAIRHAVPRRPRICLFAPAYRLPPPGSHLPADLPLGCL